jgi:PAS domain S-box-containing protein
MALGEDSIDVLHVDDDPSLVDVAATSLEREEPRLDVETETEPAAALDRVVDGDVDCVVSDYDMPRMDGLELFEAVREERPDLPFVLFTGKGNEAVAGEAVSAGVTDYLQKTTDTEQYGLLANRITNAVDQHRTERTLDAERRRFRLLFERLPQPVVEIDLDGDTPVVQRVNHAFEDVFGYASDEIVGESLDEYIVPDEHETEATEMTRRVRSESPGFTTEVTRRTADGDRRFILQNAAYEDGSGGFGIYTDVTDRRRREREIERQNTRLSALFESFPEPTVAYAYEDGEPHVVESNAAFTEVFGYDESTAVGQHIDDLVVPPDRRDEADRIDKRVKTGEAIDGHLRRQAADGVRDFRFRNIRLPDDETIDGYAIYADVTERQRRERELERRNDLFRKAQDLADVGAWEYDVRADELTWTEQVYDIHGVTGEFEPTPDAAVEFYHPEDREEIRSAVERCLTEGEPYDLELRLVTVDDEERWVRTQGDPKVEDGEVVRLRGAIQDLTARKEQLSTMRGLQYRAQRLVRERDRERIAEIAVDIASEALDLPFAGVHLANDGVLEPVAVTAAGRDRLGEAPAYERTDPDRTADRFNWGVFESGQPAVVDDIREHDSLDETETPTRSGMVLPLDAHGVLVASSPEPNALMESDRYLADILATVLTAALDRTERERTLEEQKRLLEERTERLDELVSVISHDLRSPLSVADGRLELARSDCDSEHIDAAVAAVDRSRDIVDDLLALASEGDRAVERTDVSLAGLVRDSWRNVETGGATLDVETDRTVLADRSRLRQLIENLARNAVEHGAGGSEGSVTVTVGDLEEGFYVADDGVGVSPDEREAVFESGYSTGESGTGLGLSIVEQVAREHGWEPALVTSAEGGARFEFSGVAFVEE